MGCSPPRPAIVVTTRPPARNAGTKHECTASPSTQTVQAPQSPASHPFFTPKAPRSRNHVRKHCPAAAPPPNHPTVDRALHPHPSNSRRIDSAK